MKRALRLTVVLGGVLPLAACAAAAASPSPLPTAGSGPAAATPAVRADTGRTGYSAADVRFMQGMIGHHAQALEMVALLPSRTAREDLRLLAERIRVSQESEIRSMQQWLRAHGEEVPMAGAGHAGMDHAALDHGAMDHALMPGMLTPGQMAALAASTGPAFERLFLQSMIRHHEGALQMVAELFATQGAAQEPQVFSFASDVDADQRAEIARMQALLGRLPNP
jgi:uncharacterized protein (DUF305 family)